MYAYLLMSILAGEQLAPSRVTDRPALWGPTLYSDSSGARRDFASSFSVPDSSWNLALVVNNGVGRTGRVHGARITLNGTRLKVNGGDGDDANDAKQVHLRSTNLLEVFFPPRDDEDSDDRDDRERFTRSLSVSVLGPQLSRSVPPRGAAVTVDRVATVTFPSGSFDRTTRVRIFTHTDAASSDAFDISAYFAEGPRTSFQLHILTEGQSPKISPVVSMRVPEELASVVPLTRIQVFARALYASAAETLDVFNVLPTTIDVQRRTLTAPVPPTAFISGAREGPVAVLMLGLTETQSPTPFLAPTPGACPGPTIVLPIDGDIRACGSNPCRSQSYGVNGHPGVDYSADCGTTIVRAAHSGRVSKLCENTKGCSGYGNTLVIRSDDGVLFTLYGHLSTFAVGKDDLVRVGQEIGRVGNTGTVTGPTGCHLHFEYSLGGDPVDGGGARKDPEACLAPQCPAGTVQWTGNGHCYQAVLAGGLTWADAERACESRGGHLATITSQAEETFVESLFPPTGAFWFVDRSNNALGPWFGGVQAPCTPEPACGWGWVTGEPFTYTNWSSHDPDNCCGLNQNRLEFIRDGNTGPVRWTDVEDFARFIRGYVLEIGPASEPLAR